MRFDSSIFVACCDYNKLVFVGVLRRLRYTPRSDDNPHNSTAKRKLVPTRITGGVNIFPPAMLEGPKGVQARMRLLRACCGVRSECGV
jgi:hypothetical protein